MIDETTTLLLPLVHLSRLTLNDNTAE